MDERFSDTEKYYATTMIKRDSIQTFDPLLAKEQKIKFDSAPGLGFVFIPYSVSIFNINTKKLPFFYENKYYIVISVKRST